MYFAAAEDAAVLPEAALQAASAPAVMPLMAAAEASYRKLLREIFFILVVPFVFLFLLNVRGRVPLSIVNSITISRT